MKFGLMTQIQMPRPWGPNPELHAYHNAIAQAEAADAAGFDYFWITEQHFFTRDRPQRRARTCCSPRSASARSASGSVSRSC